MDVVLFDAAELVKQYKGERGIVEGQPCPKCSQLGILNPVYYYRDINHKSGRGRCFSCYHVEGNKATSKPREIIILPNGDKVYEGKKCSSCQEKLRVYDEETGERLGLSGKAKTGACYHCARMKQSTIEPVAAHRDFLDDVRRAQWKFNIRSVEASGVVEVVAKTPAERAQVKQLIATCQMMNRHAELANLPERYDVDHYYPASGGRAGDLVGMTNIANLRIIPRSENHSKRDAVPEKFTPEQVLNIADLQSVIGYQQISKALKRWLDNHDSTDFTPERKAAYTKKQEALKARIDDIETRLGESFCRAVYAAIDETDTSLFDVLNVAQNKLKRFQTGGNQKLVEAYRRRQELHGNRGFVKVEPPDLEAMAYIGKGAILWAVEATVSNVLDGITLMIEKGMSEDERQIIDAITFDCIGWAIESMESKGDVLPFVSPLLGVFGEKIFAVKNRYGKHCLTVYTNDRKGQTRKLLDGDMFASFDSVINDKPLISASDGDVLNRLAEFDNQTLAIERQKQATANAKAEAVERIRQKVVILLNASSGVLQRIDDRYQKLLSDVDTRYGNDADIRQFFERQHKPAFDTAREKQRLFMTACREFMHVPFVEPDQAKEAYQSLINNRPSSYLPDPFRDAEQAEREEKQRDEYRLIGERLEKQDAEKVEQAKAAKQTKSDKAAFMRSAAGQQWLANQKRQQRANTRNIQYHGISRDNRK